MLQSDGREATLAAAAVDAGKAVDRLSVAATRDLGSNECQLLDL